VQDASKLGVNISELREWLQQVKRPFALSNRSPQHMQAREQMIAKDSKEEEK
jgi:hypothetical protein